MASPYKHATAARVRQACVTSGFFYVVNHGVAPELLEEVFAQSKKFFSLPLEEKEKVIYNKITLVTLPLRRILSTQTLNPKECYDIGVAVLESDLHSKKPLQEPNPYPSSDVLPGWQETMDYYYSELTNLSKRVSRLIALALNLEETCFEKPGITDESMATLRLLHYSAEKSNIELGVYGTGAHSHYGLITLLATDDVPGLQICRDKDARPQVWEEVPPMKGAIVNLGDMLERWSNGLFRSTLHRVIYKLGVERYSIPFFFETNHDCWVECFSTCCSEDNPPKYSPMTSGEYLQSKYQQTYKR